jgi:hypothetical protein
LLFPTPTAMPGIAPAPMPLTAIDVSARSFTVLNCAQGLRALGG